MSDDVHQELAQLAAEFTSLRQTHKNRFPHDAWQKVFSLVEKHPIRDVCLAINITPNYLRKKMNSISSEPVKFIELMPIKHSIVTVEGPSGYKLIVEGITSECLAILANEFFGRRSICSK